MQNGAYNPFGEDSAFLRTALKGSVATNWLPSYGDMNILKAMSSLSAVAPPPHTNEFLNVFGQNAALRTIVHTFDRTPSDQAESIWELAQIAVPERSVAFLENIEQYVADSAGLFYASESSFWGKPYNETIAELDNIRWFFRVQQFNGTLPARYNVASNDESLLPGAPWSELPSFSGIWYPATKQNAISATIAPKTILRMFVSIPAAVNYDWRIAGRLTARIQSSKCQEAQTNARNLS